MALTTLNFRPRTCEFCGRIIEPATTIFGGVEYRTPGECQCEGARAQRAADEEAERREHAARIAEQRAGIYRKAGIKPRFMGAVPDPTHLEHIESGHGLYLVGDTDAGKTHAATALKVWKRSRLISGRTAEPRGSSAQSAEKCWKAVR